MTKPPTKSRKPPWAGTLPEIKLDETPSGKEEEGFFADSMDDALLHSQNLQNWQFRQDIANRKRYSGRAFWIAICWLAFVVVLTGLQFYSDPIAHSFCPPPPAGAPTAAQECARKAGLGATEFAAVMGSTTITVLGFWLLVGRYLFHRPGPSPKD